MTRQHKPLTTPQRQALQWLAQGLSLRGRAHGVTVNHLKTLGLIENSDTITDAGRAAIAAGVREQVRFFRVEPAQTHFGTVYRVKDERGDWIADFADKADAERFSSTSGVLGRDGEDLSRHTPMVGGKEQ